MFCLPISTFMYLWAIYIFPRSVCRGPIVGIKYLNSWHRNWNNLSAQFNFWEYMFQISVQCAVTLLPDLKSGFVYLQYSTVCTHLTLREIMLWLFLRTVISPWISTLVMLPVRKTSFLNPYKLLYVFNFIKAELYVLHLCIVQYVFSRNSYKKVLCLLWLLNNVLMSNFFYYTVKKCNDFPFPSRDVTNQTISGQE